MWKAVAAGCGVLLPAAFIAGALSNNPEAPASRAAVVLPVNGQDQPLNPGGTARCAQEVDGDEIEYELLTASQASDDLDDDTVVVPCPPGIGPVLRSDDDQPRQIQPGATLAPLPTRADAQTPSPGSGGSDDRDDNGAEPDDDDDDRPRPTSPAPDDDPDDDADDPDDDAPSRDDDTPPAGGTDDDDTVDDETDDSEDDD